MLTIDDMMNPDFVKIYEDCLKYSRGALYESYGISKDVRKEASELYIKMQSRKYQVFRIFGWAQKNNIAIRQKDFRIEC